MKWRKVLHARSQWTYHPNEKVVPLHRSWCMESHKSWLPLQCHCSGFFCTDENAKGNIKATDSVIPRALVLVELYILFNSSSSSSIKVYSLRRLIFHFLSSQVINFLFSKKQHFYSLLHLLYFILSPLNSINIIFLTHVHLRWDGGSIKYMKITYRHLEAKSSSYIEILISLCEGKML